MPNEKQGKLPSTGKDVLDRYIAGVAWIAVNDEPTLMEDRRVQIEQQMTVVMLADIFNTTEVRVVDDVLSVRKVTNHPGVRLAPR